jgi:hypothetical protein
MATKQIKRNNEILKMVKKGFTMVKIGEKYGVSKQRISQIINKNEDPRTIRLNKKLDYVINEIKNGLKNGESKNSLRNRLGLTPYFVKILLIKKLDLRVQDREKIKKRNLDIIKLYKKGLTAYEIINNLKNKYPDLKYPDQIYRNVSTKTNRNNTRQKKSGVLKNEIIKLSRKNTSYDILKILKNKGFRNLNGGELKLHSVNYYKYKKSN